MGTSNIKRRKAVNQLFHILFFVCTLVGIIFLVFLLSNVIKNGWKWLRPELFTNYPSRFPSKAGLKSALFGSIWLITTTALISFPLGVGTAIYLELYTKRGKFQQLLQLNISNLAGVPSVLYGMLGLTVFVRLLGLQTSILAGALTLSLLILPVIIVSSQEALKSVPSSIIEGSYALGISKWKTISGVILPYSLPGILTGTILALSRALGEAAPLILVGASGYLADIPKSPMSNYSALPIQIYNWTGRPKVEFQELAAAGIIVLLVFLLTANAVAIILRNKFQHRMD